MESSNPDAIPKPATPDSPNTEYDDLSLRSLVVFTNEAHDAHEPCHPSPSPNQLSVMKRSPPLSSPSSTSSMKSVALLNFERMCEQLSVRLKHALRRGQERSHCRAYQYLASYHGHEYEQRPQQLQMLMEMAKGLKKESPQWEANVEHLVRQLEQEWKCVRTALTPHDCWGNGGLDVIQDIAADLADLKKGLRDVLAVIPPNEVITQALLSTERQKFDTIWKHLNAALLTLKQHALITLQLHRLLEQLENDLASAQHSSSPTISPNNLALPDRISHFRHEVLQQQRLCHQLNLRCLEAVCLIEQGRLVSISRSGTAMKTTVTQFSPEENSEAISRSEGSGRKLLKIVVPSLGGLESGLGSEASLHQGALHVTSMHHFDSKSTVDTSGNYLTGPSPAATEPTSKISTKLPRPCRRPRRRLLAIPQFSSLRRTGDPRGGLRAPGTHSRLSVYNAGLWSALRRLWTTRQDHTNHDLRVLMSSYGLFSSTMPEVLQNIPPPRPPHHHYSLCRPSSRELMVVLSENDLFHPHPIQHSLSTSSLSSSVGDVPTKHSNVSNGTLPDWCSHTAADVRWWRPRRARSLELPRIFNTWYSAEDVLVPPRDPQLQEDDEEKTPCNNVTPCRRTSGKVHPVNYYHLACIGDMEEEEETGEETTVWNHNNNHKDSSDHLTVHRYQFPSTCSKASGGSSEREFWARSGAMAMASGVYCHPSPLRRNQRPPEPFTAPPPRPHEDLGNDLNGGGVEALDTSKSFLGLNNSHDALPDHPDGMYEQNSCCDMSADSLMESKGRHRHQEETEVHSAAGIRHYMALAEEADRWMLRGRCVQRGTFGPSLFQVDRSCQTEPFLLYANQPPLECLSGEWDEEPGLEEYWDPVPATYYTQEEEGSESYTSRVHSDHRDILGGSEHGHTALALFDEDFSVASSSSNVCGSFSSSLSPHRHHRHPMEKAFSESALMDSRRMEQQCDTPSSSQNLLSPHQFGSDEDAELALTSDSSLVASLVASEPGDVLEELEEASEFTDKEQTGPVSQREVQQHLVNSYEWLIQSAHSLPLPLSTEENGSGASHSVQRIVQHVQQVLAHAQGNIECLQRLHSGHIGVILQCESSPVSLTEHRNHPLAVEVATLLNRWRSLQTHCHRLLDYLHHLHRLSEEADHVQDMIKLAANMDQPITQLHPTHQNHDELDADWQTALTQRETLLKNCAQQLAQYQRNLSTLHSELLSLSMSTFPVDDMEDDEHWLERREVSSSNEERDRKEASPEVVAQKDRRDGLARWCASEERRLMALQHWTESLVVRNHALQLTLSLVMRAFQHLESLYGECEAGIQLHEVRLDKLKQTNANTSLEETDSMKMRLGHIKTLRREAMRSDQLLREADGVWSVLLAPSLEVGGLQLLPSTTPKVQQPDILCGNGDGVAHHAVTLAPLPGQRTLASRKEQLQARVNQLLQQCQQEEARLRAVLSRPNVVSEPSVIFHRSPVATSRTWRCVPFLCGVVLPMGMLLMLWMLAMALETSPSWASFLETLVPRIHNPNGAPF